MAPEEHESFTEYVQTVGALRWEQDAQHRARVRDERRLVLHHGREALRLRNAAQGLADTIMRDTGCSRSQLATAYTLHQLAVSGGSTASPTSGEVEL